MIITTNGNCMNDESLLVISPETLRDLFAAFALAGLIAGTPDDVNVVSCDLMASGAYKLADAMLRARAGEKG